MEDERARVADEAIRVYRRYAREFVESFRLCPWAERARLDGSMTERVLFQRGVDAFVEPLAIADDLASISSIEVALLIFPWMDVAELAFERFVSEIWRRHADPFAPGPPPFAMASFHPRAEPDFGSPARLVPFIRRTPDPTIQLVRMHVLERVRAGTPGGTEFFDPSLLSAERLREIAPLSLRERIARSNHRTLSGPDFARALAVLDSVHADRERSYGRGPEVAVPVSGE
ncbi:MAG TPA: hypothetical protein VF989_07950 [Polyangiaceae bacterium]